MRELKSVILIRTEILYLCKFVDHESFGQVWISSSDADNSMLYFPNIRFIDISNELSFRSRQHHWLDIRIKARCW